MGAGHNGRGWLVGVAGMALAVLPGTAGATEWCTPATTQLAYDALLIAAPDGSDLDVQARRIADEATAQGTFDTDDTLFRLDDLAWDADFAFDCDREVYVYAPEVTQDDGTGDQAALEDEPLDDEDVADAGRDQRADAGAARRPPPRRPAGASR